MRSSWQRQPQGDGELALIPPSESGRRVVAEFTTELAAQLHRYNLRRPPDQRLRLRMAFDIGIADADGANGFPGEAVVRVSRLVGCRPVRDALAAAPHADLAVILSEQVYTDTIGQGHTSVSPAALLGWEVWEKSYHGFAWLWLPGSDVHRLGLRPVAGFSALRGTDSSAARGSHGPMTGRLLAMVPAKRPSRRQVRWSLVGVLAVALLVTAIVGLTGHHWSDPGTGRPADTASGRVCRVTPSPLLRADLAHAVLHCAGWHPGGSVACWVRDKQVCTYLGIGDAGVFDTALHIEVAYPQTPTEDSILLTINEDRDSLILDVPIR